MSEGSDKAISFHDLTKSDIRNLYYIIYYFDIFHRHSGDLGDLRPDGHGDVNDTRTFDWLSLGHGGILGRSLVVSNVTLNTISSPSIYGHILY